MLGQKGFTKKKRTLLRFRKSLRQLPLSTEGVKDINGRVRKSGVLRKEGAEKERGGGELSSQILNHLSLEEKKAGRNKRKSPMGREGERSKYCGEEKVIVIIGVLTQGSRVRKGGWGSQKSFLDRRSRKGGEWD